MAQALSWMGLLPEKRKKGSRGEGTTRKLITIYNTKHIKNVEKPDE